MQKNTKARILVVDDEEITRQLLLDFLGDVGYQIETAASGEEALNKIRQTPFDLVITDVRMPGMSGIDLIQSVNDGNLDTCFLVITGYASLDTAITAIKSGAYDYITKPFNLDELRIIVERAVERQFLLREAKQKEYYRELSILDGLTQVYNHRYIHELLARELDRALRYPQEFSILMLDIDDFKKFNDTFGHLSGDFALKAIAKIISASVRKVDLVGRYGGEEFLIILPHTNKEGACIAAQRVCAAVAQTELKDDRDTILGHLTASIGIATFPPDGKSKESIVKAADSALYQAKRDGKNRVISAVPPA
jgi:diguanylate cyclase (GGDEF)-like protein